MSNSYYLLFRRCALILSFLQENSEKPVVKYYNKKVDIIKKDSDDNDE